MAETEKTLNTIIVLRNDKSTDWATSDVILREGELGVSYIYNEDGKTVKNVVVKAGNGIGKWADLKQVEGVFEEAVTLTKDFGYFSGVPSGGKKTFDGTNGTVNTAGMTTSEFILAAFQQTIEPKITAYPELSFSLTSHTTDTGTNEIGSNIISVSYEGKVSTAGTYDVAGKSVGSGLNNDDTSWSVTYGSDSTTTKTTRTGSFTTNVQITSTTATGYCSTSATGTMDFTDVTIPTNNLGTSRPDAKITKLKNGTSSQSFTVTRSVTGYRDTWQYVGTDDTFELTSANIRSKTTSKGGSTSFGTLQIPAGTKRVMLAVPGDKTLKSVIDVDGQGLDVKANFTKDIIAIEGANGYTAANYSVFHFENPNGVAKTQYTISFN